MENDDFYVDPSEFAERTYDEDAEMFGNPED